MSERVFKPVLLLVALLTFSGSLAWAQTSTVPGDFDQLAARAEQARSANRPEEAVALYRKALALRPRWAEGWFNLGTLLYDRDAYTEAAQAFRRATDLSPRVGTGWVMLGLSEFKLGRQDEALNHLRQGRRLGISAGSNLNQVVRYHEGLLLMGRGDFIGARKTLGHVSREGVNSAELITALGLAALHISPAELPRVEAATREAIPRAGLAEHLAAQRKSEEAAREYERLIADYPQVPNVQLAYGRFLLDQGEVERAVTVLQRELVNSPRHLLARLLIADTKLKLKDYAGGLPYAEEALRLRPQLPLGHYLLGSLLLGMGQTERAIRELETARATEPNDSRVYYALGTAYTRAGRKEDAARARAAFARLSKLEEEAAAANP